MFRIISKSDVSRALVIASNFIRAFVVASKRSNISLLIMISVIPTMFKNQDTCPKCMIRGVTWYYVLSCRYASRAEQVGNYGSERREKRRTRSSIIRRSNTAANC
ncbi:unnamed protein product [Leptosia nina]|uniref:Uncharacterized protein n=1 Tax=Leptosia nina TaxID=320188 RepID=A0AAV1JRJ9_9NEOP